MLCPSCATPVAEGARFCSSCGHAVAAAQSEERRIVTVLFADVVGFTGLAERRDPETVKRLIDRLFARLAEVITGFGGRVDKLLGDGVLALFGAPVAHEDDAERAVRAALRMPLGPTESTGVSALRNLVGEVPAPAARLPAGVNLHPYGKSSRAGRKLGHLTAVAQRESDAMSAADAAFAALNAQPASARG